MSRIRRPRAFRRHLFTVQWGKHIITAIPAPTRISAANKALDVWAAQWADDEDRVIPEFADVTVTCTGRADGGEPYSQPTRIIAFFK